MRVAVVGLGHIGLPLAVQYASRGHDVLGVDVDSRIVDTLNRGESPHRDEQALIDRVPGLVAAGKLRATTWADASGFSDAEVVVVIVPVVVDADRQIDFGPIDAATRDIAANLGGARAGGVRDDPAGRHHPQAVRADAGRRQRPDAGRGSLPRLQSRTGAGGTRVPGPCGAIRRSWAGRATRARVARPSSTAPRLIPGRRSGRWRRRRRPR